VLLQTSCFSSAILEQTEAFRSKREEVPGPDPDPPEQLARGAPQRLDVMFVEPYPRTEEDLEASGDK
jgi:hypothetical protein